jgi:hypothetical protein
MSTIIEWGRRSGRLVGAACVALAAWFALAALVTVLAEPVRTVAVFAPASAALAAVAHADARLVGARGGFILVRGENAGFVRQLYAGGGWLVLPVLRGGCLGAATGV